MIRYAAERGYSKMVHECRSKDDISTYEKAGFSLTAEFDQYYKHKEDIDKIMVLELSDLKKTT
jgi:hypothetical protein